MPARKKQAPVASKRRNILASKEETLESPARKVHARVAKKEETGG